MCRSPANGSPNTPAMPTPNPRPAGPALRPGTWRCGCGCNWRGRFRGKQIIAAAALDETHRPQIVRTPPKNPAIDHAGFYGLGWNIDYDAGGLVHWSHSGGFDLGAATCVSVLPAAAARHRRADQCPADRRAGGAQPQLFRSGPDRQGRAGLADALRPADGGGDRAHLRHRHRLCEGPAAAIAGIARRRLCRFLPKRSLWSDRDRRERCRGWH